jgi:catechol-2,3-dioxygenase
MAIKRLNHAVLFVRDAEESARWYAGMLGFKIVEQMPGAVFMSAPASDNHHDLGLFSIGPKARTPGRGQQVGLYHLAWEVEAIEDLPEIRNILIGAGAFTGESDHGTSLSLYARDIDGNEFEVFWMVPKEEWATRGFGARRLRLDDEIAKRKAS